MMRITPYALNDRGTCALSTSWLHPIDSHLMLDMVRRHDLRQVWVLQDAKGDTIGAFNTKEDVTLQYMTLTGLPRPQVHDTKTTTLPGRIHGITRRQGVFGAIRRRLRIADGA